jgi:sulfide:quinone oxidoreductase
MPHAAAEDYGRIGGIGRMPRNEAGRTVRSTGEPSMTRFARRPRLVVAGGGVAALEACLAAHTLADDAVALTLVAPDPSFVHRPADAPDPVAARRARRAPLDGFAASVGAELVQDSLVSVDPVARRVRTLGGHELEYEALLVAIGAVPLPVPGGALAFGNRHLAVEVRDVLLGLHRGAFPSAALVAPPAPAWRLELYELALQLAVGLRQEGVAAQLTVVTCEEAPLAILGPRTAGSLRHTLTAHGLHVVESSYLRAVRGDEVLLAPGDRRVPAAVVLAAPRLGGPAIRGLPRDAGGYLPVDRLGRVRGVDAVYAAGDCADFPIKHASLAAQQADAAAAAICAAAGLPVVPVPFKPVVRCMLPSRLRWYVDAPIGGGAGDATRLSPKPLWPTATRWGARLLSPHLGAAPERAGPSSPLSRSAAVENARRALRRLGAR